jgi:YD repeat-containing protein
MTKRQLLKKDTYLKTKIEDKVTWKDYEIKGKVKQYTRAEYKIINGSKKAFFRKQLINFDEDGKILDACDLNVKGEKTARGYYDYDKEGRLIELRSYDADDKLVENVKYTYNDKGIKIKEDNNNVNLAVNSTWLYDEKGNVIESIEYSKDTLITLVKMKYHKETNALIEEDTIRYKPNGQFNFREVTKYNKYGVVLSRLKYKDKEKMKIEIKEFHNYDSKGNEYKLFIQAIGTRPKTCIYKNIYDEKGQLIKSTSAFYTWIFKYDNRGNQIKKTSYTSQDYLELELYNEYDMDNNMIKETRIEYDRSPGAGINKKITSIYDKEGKLIEWARDDKDGHYKHQTLYNDKGIMIEQVLDSPGQSRPKIKITYKVDSLGNLLEKREYAIYENNEELLTNIYEYSYIFY